MTGMPGSACSPSSAVKKPACCIEKCGLPRQFVGVPTSPQPTQGYVVVVGWGESANPNTRDSVLADCSARARSARCAGDQLEHLGELRIQTRAELAAWGHHDIRHDPDALDRWIIAG